MSTLRRTLLVLLALLFVLGMATGAVSADPVANRAVSVQTGTGGLALKPVGALLSLEFYKQQGSFIVAHDDKSVSIGKIDGMTDNDSSIVNFRKRSGLGNSTCVSFESMAWPGRYLRRWYSGVRVSGGGVFDPGFNDDATFCRVNQRYESYGLRDHYLRVSGSQVLLSKVDIWNDYDSLYETILFEQDPHSLSLNNYGPGGGWTHQGNDENWTFTNYGPCTGLTPWNGSPVTTQAWILTYYGNLAPWGTKRIITKQVTSTPGVGYYPYITLFRLYSGELGIYKIKTGSGICLW